MSDKSGARTDRVRRRHVVCRHFGFHCFDHANPMPEQKWTETLWLVRHGQSSGNVARDAAEASGHEVIEIADRDVDVPLSSLGEQQSDTLGLWVRQLEQRIQPQVVLHSPYVRAQQTAQRILKAAGLQQIPCVQDERLREKEFGVLDRLTVAGIRSRFPELAQQRQHVGKFYFRPPGGESWCDVILRLRSFLDMLTRDHHGERVLVVAHQVTVTCLRYLLERMTERDILEIDRRSDVPNCSLTSYAFDPTAGRNGKLRLTGASFVAPLEHAGTTVTTDADAAIAPKA